MYSRSGPAGEITRRTSGMEPLWDLCLMITILCSLGFPGNLEALFPGALNNLILYGPFLLQIMLMILASGDSVLEIRLLDFKKKYIPVYLMLAVWFSVSIVSTSFPKEQLISCVRFSTTALFALWIVDKYEIHDLLVITYYAGLLLLFFTFVCVALLPGRVYTWENGEKSFCGLFTTKNPCASELSFELVIHALLYKQWKDKKKNLPRFFLPSILLHIGMLFACKGMGALFCAVIPIAYLFFLDGKGAFRRRFHWGMIHTVVSVGFLIIAMTILPLLKPVFDALGKDVTLTGRTPMWEQLIQVMTNHNSFTGFGFTMFWKDSQAVKLFHQGFSRGSWGNTMTFGAHNTLLEMWLDVGLLGIAAYFLMTIAATQHPNDLEQSKYDFCSAFFIWQTIKGLTERSYIPLHYQTLFLFLAVAVGLSGEKAKAPLRRWRSDNAHAAKNGLIP